MYAFKEQETTDNIDLLSQMLDIVDKTTVELTKYLEGYQDDIKSINDNNKWKRKNANQAVRKLMSTILALSLIYVPVGAHKLINRVSVGKESYQVKITTYEKDKTPKVVNTRKYLNDNPDDKVYIVETIPSNDFNYDLVMTYDATNEKCDKVEDYYNLDLSTLPLVSKENVTERRENKESKRVILEKVDFNSIDNETQSGLLIVFYIFYTVLVVILESASLFCNNISFIIGYIKQLLEDISKIKDEDDAKELEKKANQTKEIIMQVLRSDKRLLEKFNEEYEKNMCLMSDPSLLLSKYDELIESIKRKSSEVKLERLTIKSQ